MPDVGSLSLENAHFLIQTLHNLGVTHFCLSPGSRSIPLSLAAARFPHTTHFDERGIGFYALGYAKAKKSPVAIIVTSGSAVANLFPALTEAYTSHIPLILLSADRPVELRDCGANQTLDQIKIFTSCTHWHVDLPLSDPLTPSRYIQSCASYAVQQSIERAGPVHINCMIREPSFSSQTIHAISPICTYEISQFLPPPSTFAAWAADLSSYEKGVIILGMDALSQDRTPFLALAEKLQWPIITDILSGGRNIGEHPLHITHMDILCKIGFDPTIDVLLQIGGRIVSKALSFWIAKQKGPHLLVIQHTHRYDPQSHITHVMHSPTNEFCQHLTAILAQKEYFWALSWKELSMQVEQKIEAIFAKNSVFSEAAIVRFFQEFPSIFFANSMPIRYADLFVFPKQEKSIFWASRGVSGIDGNIATIAGIAKATEKPLLAIIGDMTALHDINSLALVARSKTPIYIVILNNQGGGIFSFLPIAQNPSFCDSIFSIDPSISFAALCQGFSLPSFSLSSYEELQTLWDNISSSSCVIECRTNRESVVSDLESIIHQIQSSIPKELLCCTTDLMEIR